MCAPAAERSVGSLLAVIIGSGISITSVVNNSVLFYCLIRSKKCFQCYFQFLLVLSLFDVIISMCYVPVILVDSLKDWLNSVLLAKLWWSYFVYLLALTHVTMTAASFVLVCALLERYLITIRSSQLKTFQQRRSMACVCSFVLALVTKGGILFELDIFPEEDESCRNTVNEFYVDMTAVNSQPLYGTVYRFWIRNIVTVFVPFFLLTFINFKTLVKLKAQLKEAKCQEGRKFSVRVENKSRPSIQSVSESEAEVPVRNDEDDTELQSFVHLVYIPLRLESVLNTTYSGIITQVRIISKVRSATWTLLLVCLLYLLSNLPNVIVTAWEFIDMQSLQNEFFSFYMFSTDLVSLLVVVACAMRLPIYMLCNPELRRVITNTMKVHIKPKIQQCKSDYL
ncbi:hypothetical protein Aduo_006540 [Ancylostoma duodenale]